MPFISFQTLLLTIFSDFLLSYKRPLFSLRQLSTNILILSHNNFVHIRLTLWHNILCYELFSTICGCEMPETTKLTDKIRRTSQWKYNLAFLYDHMSRRWRIFLVASFVPSITIMNSEDLFLFLNLILITYSFFCSPFALSSICIILYFSVVIYGILILSQFSLCLYINE